MRLIGLAVILAVSLILAPLVAEAQPGGRLPRIGVLASSSPEGSYLYSLREGLRELGYTEGQNIVVEWRWARGQDGRLTDLAAELVRLKVDIIVVNNNAAIAATQRATRTIPIVMVIAADPVGFGFVASLARPGSNITGLSTQDEDLAGKRAQILKETVPNLSRLAILWDPTLPGGRSSVRVAEVAAKAQGIQVLVLEARNPSDFDSAFAAMTRESANAMRLVGSGMLMTHRARLAELAVRHRLPVMCTQREFVAAGCLVSYGPSFSDLARRAAYYVDQILKGAKPADLPVEQPTKFEFVINLKTAKALGLTIPQSLLLRADEVIQ